MNPILGDFLISVLMGLSDLFMGLSKLHMALSLFCIRVMAAVKNHVKETNKA